MFSYGVNWHSTTSATFFWGYHFTYIQIIFILQLCTFHILRIGDKLAKTHSSFTKRQRHHIHNRLCPYLGPEGTKGVRQNGLDFQRPHCNGY